MQEQLNESPKATEAFAQGPESKRKQKFYAVLRVKQREVDKAAVEALGFEPSDVMTVVAENRTALRKVVLGINPIEVIAIFRGRQMEFEARTQINFC